MLDVPLCSVFFFKDALASVNWTINLLLTNKKVKSDLKIVNFIFSEEKRSCPIKVESMLIERDQMGLGENVTLTCRKICNAVIQSNRFQPHPRIVAPSHNFKDQTSNVGFKSLKLKKNLKHFRE